MGGQRQWILVGGFDGSSVEEEQMSVERVFGLIVGFQVGLLVEPFHVVLLLPDLCGGREEGVKVFRSEHGDFKIR